MKRKSSELFMSFCRVKVSRFVVDREHITIGCAKATSDFHLSTCACMSFFSMSLPSVVNGSAIVWKVCEVLGEQIDLSQTYHVRNLNR